MGLASVSTANTALGGAGGESFVSRIRRPPEFCPYCVAFEHGGWDPTAPPPPPTHHREAHQYQLHIRSVEDHVMLPIQEESMEFLYHQVQFHPLSFVSRVWNICTMQWQESGAAAAAKAACPAPSCPNNEMLIWAGRYSSTCLSMCNLPCRLW